MYQIARKIWFTVHDTRSQFMLQDDREGRGNELAGTGKAQIRKTGLLAVGETTEAIL